MSEGMGNTYNVVGARETLEEMLKQFPAISVEDEYDDGDWNIQLPDEAGYDDRFTDWCEDHDVEYEML